MRELLIQKQSSITGTYWEQNYKVGIRFGGTELSAFIEWEQNVCTLLPLVVKSLIWISYALGREEVRAGYNHPDAVGITAPTQHV